MSGAGPPECLLCSQSVLEHPAGEFLERQGAPGSCERGPAAAQDAFDVRWCRGSIAEQIFLPWRARLEAGGARLLGGRRALRVLPGRDGRVSRHDIP